MELYIHIPFCVRKCNYCDFLSYPGYGCGADERHRSLSYNYIEALCAELKEIAGSHPTIDTCFIGGGTPSVLTDTETERLLQAVTELMPKDKQASCTGFTEFTIECNPGTLTKEKLLLYKKYGVNRISMGLQSTDNGILSVLGRIHTFEQFTENFELARSLGFDNINVDLISGVPGQTIKNWKETMEKVTALSPEHISAYSLILEEGTPLYDSYLKDPAGLKLPDEDTEREIYHYTLKYLEEKGYHRYEISNYAKPGYECRHNLGYWTGEEYIGTGLGASSYLNSENAQSIKHAFDNASDTGEKKNTQSELNNMSGSMFRIKNTDDIDAYIRCFNNKDADIITNVLTNGKQNSINNNRKKYTIEETLDKEALMSEYCILGLRLTEGISESGFSSRFGEKLMDKYGTIIDKYLNAGLLEQNGDRIRFTEKGLDLSNTVLCEFL